VSQLPAYLHSPTRLLPRCSLRFSCFNRAPPIVTQSCRVIVGRLCPSTGLNSRAPRGTYLCLAGFTWLQVFFTQPYTLTWDNDMEKRCSQQHLTGPRAPCAVLLRIVAKGSSYIRALLQCYLMKKCISEKSLHQHSWDMLRDIGNQFLKMKLLYPA
jgi:hypothetical protein